MEKRLQDLIVGVLISVTQSSSIVVAKQIIETAELFYNNIKIYFDGGEILPKDADGDIVLTKIINTIGFDASEKI